MEQLYGQILADVIVYILGGGGGYGWFQKKKIFCRLISRGKHYCKEIAGEKESLQWKNLKLGKNLVCKGKKFYHQRFWSKRIVTHPNHPYPPAHLMSNDRSLNHEKRHRICIQIRFQTWKSWLNCSSSFQSITMEIAAIKSYEVAERQKRDELMFGVFQREFLPNYSAYRTQIFRDNWIAMLFQYSEILFYWLHHIMISIHVNALKNVNEETPVDGYHGYMENKII